MHPPLPPLLPASTDCGCEKPYSVCIQQCACLQLARAPFVHGGSGKFRASTAGRRLPSKLACCHSDLGMACGRRCCRRLQEDASLGTRSADVSRESEKSGSPRLWLIPGLPRTRSCKHHARGPTLTALSMVFTCSTVVSRYALGRPEVRASYEGDTISALRCCRNACSPRCAQSLCCDLCRGHNCSTEKGDPPLLA